MEFLSFLIAVAAAIGFAVAIPFVRAIRARLGPTWRREILVAVVRGLLIAPSIVLGGHGGIAMPTVACLPFWLLMYPERFNLWYLAPFAIVAIVSLLTSASASRSGLTSTARPVVRFGIWLPLGALTVAAGLFFLADHVIVRPGGESNVNYAFFTLLLLLGVAAAGVAVVVLISLFGHSNR